MRNPFWPLLASVCLVLSVAAMAAEPNIIPRIDVAPKLDGVPDEEAWSRAWKIDLAYEVGPGENTPASVRTEALMMYDTQNLYVGIRAWDPDPEAIRATFSDRDDIWEDDWAGVILDTFNDERRDYAFVVNPLGVQADLIEGWSGAIGNDSWDGIWDSAARIGRDGWTAEMRIPFSTLHFPQGGGIQTWGFDAIRGYQRDVFRHIGAFPRDRDNVCYLCQAIKIEGFEGIDPGRNLEIQPTLTASRTESRPHFPHGGFDDREDDLATGLTARWGITPSMTLAGTVNPDFSQVEADALQLDVNEPFALFFPEKRPFFMEGEDHFQTLMQATYTRMLRDPRWGAKAIGREGAHTIGAYVVDDAITNLILPGRYSSSTATLAQSNTAAVARYRFDASDRFVVGALATDRTGLSYRNTVAGLDANIRLSSADLVQVQALGSRTRYPDEIAAGNGRSAGPFRGSAFDLFYYRDSRSFGWWLRGTSFDPGFRADLGYVPQVDIRGGQVGLDLNRIGGDRTWYTNLNLKTKVEHQEDHAGGLLFDEQAVQLTVQSRMQSRCVLRLSQGRRGYAGRSFDADGLIVVASLQPERHGSVSLTGKLNDAVDYANVRQGSLWQLKGALSYRIGRYLHLDGMHLRERMRVDEGRLYTADISELSLAWRFSARSFIRTVLQRTDYTFATDLYHDDRNARSLAMASQILYGYKLNPQTILFLGYSDNLRGDADVRLGRTDRTVFAKIGYAWLP